MNPFMEKDLGELRGKLMTCNMIIRNLKGEWKDEPEAPERLKHYLEHQKHINEAILARRLEEGPLPDPVVVQLKPVKIAGRARSV